MWLVIAVILIVDGVVITPPLQSVLPGPYINNLGWYTHTSTIYRLLPIDDVPTDDLLLGQNIIFFKNSSSTVESFKSYFVLKY